MVAIPDELLDQVDNGNVLLFIGEQIMCDDEGRMIMQHLAELIGTRCEMRIDENLVFRRVAQVYEKRHGRQALVQFVRDQLEVLGYEPQQVHRLIARLTHCNVLVTTCFDRKLERAFELARRPLNVIVGNLDVAFEDQRKARLYKLYGSIERVDSLVLTDDDYEFFLDGQASISILLQGYLSSKTVVFLGYQLDEPFFRELYRKTLSPLGIFARHSYAVGPLPKSEVSDWCQRRGIMLIDAEPVIFLDALNEQLAARAHPASRFLEDLINAPVAPPLVVPYKRLDYYTESDVQIFQGRQHESEMLSAQIHAHRIVVVHGASGVGKTSLLLAGVVPRLTSAMPPYQIVYVRVFEDPVVAIRHAVRRLPGAEKLPDTDRLIDFLHAATKLLDGALLIILDQVEEFFIRLGPPFRAAFIDELGTIFDAHDVPVKFVFALREDRLADMAEFERRIPDIFLNRRRLLPLSRAQAHEAITRPAGQIGMHYEPILIDRLMQDLVDSRDDSVMPPQLQLVCNALYERSRMKQRETFTIADYEALGGAQQVLVTYLDEELQRFDATERRLARAVLEELVTWERTKKVTSAAELATALAAPDELLNRVLGKLMHARLVRLVELTGTSESAYELTHEYLIEKIELSPETLDRKEAEELLRQSLANWQRYKTLLSDEALELINSRRHLLQLSSDAEQLLSLSEERRHKRSRAPWVLRYVLGGLLGGALGGVFVGVFGAFYSNESFITIVLSNIIIGLGIGLLLASGIGVAGVWNRRGHFLPLVGGGVAGIMIGAVFGPIIEPSAALALGLLLGGIWGVGIALAIDVLNRLRSRLRLMALSLFAVLVAGVVGVRPSGYWSLLALMSLGIVIGLTITRVRIVDNARQSSTLPTKI